MMLHTNLVLPALAALKRLHGYHRSLLGDVAAHGEEGLLVRPGEGFPDSQRSLLHDLHEARLLGRAFELGEPYGTRWTLTPLGNAVLFAEATICAIGKEVPHA